MRKFIYGMHDRTGECIEHFGDKLSWVVATEGIGRDPNDHGGRDYGEWSDQGINVIVRINHGYGEAGTIPEPEHYEDFAQRVGNFVANSAGCGVWIIGNEMNHSRERPQKKPILPSQYAVCYVLCRNAIRDLPGHENDLVVVGAIAPWNVQTKYLGNESGDWIKYFTDMLGHIKSLQCNVDAIACHTYSHGSDPALITSGVKMNPPYGGRHFHFLAYQDFMDAIPDHLRDVPVYITETDQDVAWANVNQGWVQAAYREINDWNSILGIQQIHCLCLYRWPKYDRWFIDGKHEVHADFRAAMAHGYRIGNNGNGDDDNSNGNGGDMPTIELPLINSKFEDGFRQVNNIGELTVAKDWHPWWHWQSARPEYKAATSSIDPRRVHSGNVAQQWFNNFAKHTAGIYQQLGDIPIGAELAFSAWVQAWVSDKDDPGQSNGRYRMRIGLNPYGGTDPESDDIVWSNDGNAIQPYDEYQYLSVEAVARSDRVTVFIWGQNEWAQKNVNAYVDDCKLLAQIEEDEPDPEPPPNGEGFTEAEIRAFAREEAEQVVLETVEALTALLRG